MLLHSHVGLASKADVAEGVLNEPLVGLGLRFDVTLRPVMTQEAYS